MAQPSSSYFQSSPHNVQLRTLLYMPSLVLVKYPLTRATDLLDSIQFRFHLQISATEYPPKGYLFLCPTQYFLSGPSFRWPDCPAYWSLDPSGIERLSVAEANARGFPSLNLTPHFFGKSWDAGVYAGLRKFHEGKGFDPDSQDVACHLGFELYRVSSELNITSSHGEHELRCCITTHHLFVEQASDSFILDAEPLELSPPWQFFMAAKLTVIIFLLFVSLHPYLQRLLGNAWFG